MRIIHLEDDELIAEFVHMMCTGHEYVWVQSSREARTIASRQPFDVALVDLGLQHGDSGLYFLDWLLTDAPLTYRVLVSGVTTRDMVSVVEKAHAALDKPFTAQQFVQTLERARTVLDRREPIPGPSPSPSPNVDDRSGLLR